MDIFDLINDEFDRLLRRVRKGFYIARITDPAQTYRRVQTVPDWLTEGALDNMRRIASPILDVIPAVGARMAVISQDGVPELGAVLGQIWDDLAPKMTVWLRANLQKSPGHLEVGATQGLRIRVGENAADGSAAFEIDETEGGEIVIESDQGNCRVIIGSDGTVKIEATRVELAGASSPLVRNDLLTAELVKISTAIEALSAQVAPLTPPPPVPVAYVPGSTAATKVFG